MSIMLHSLHRYDRGDQRERDRSRKRGRQMDSDDEEIIPTRSTRRRPAPGSSRRSDPANDSQRGIGRNTRGGLKRDDSGQARMRPLMIQAPVARILRHRGIEGTACQCGLVTAVKDGIVQLASSYLQLAVCWLLLPLLAHCECMFATDRVSQ